MKEKFEYFIEHSDNAFFVASLTEEKTIYLNKKASELFEITAETCDFQKIFSSSALRLRDVLESQVNAAAHSIIYNATVTKADGSPLLADLQVGFFNKEKTQVFLELILNKDLSQKMALFQVDKSFRPEAILDLDEELTIIYCNKHFISLLGGRETQCLDCFEQKLSRTFLSESKAEILANIHENLKNFDYHSEEIQIQTVDHCKKWVSLHLEKRNVHESGQEKIIAYLTNIDDKIQREQKYSVLEQYLSIMQESTSDIIYRVDVASNTLYHSNHFSNIHGLEKEIPDYVNVFIHSTIIHPDDIQIYLNNMEEFNQGGSPQTPVRFSLASKEYQWYKITGKRIYDKNGKVTEILGTLINVHKEKTLESNYSTLNQYYQAIQSLSGESLYTLDINTRTLQSKGILVEEIGLPDTLKNFPDSVYELIHSDDLESFKDFTTTTLAKSESTLSLRIKTKDRTYQWYQLKSVVIHDEQGKSKEVLGKIKNIQLQKELERKATHDMMTKVLNKVSFQEAVSKLLEQAGENETHALIFIDLDDFKWVNDNLGHAFGDFLLVTVGKRLKRVVREDDLIGRLGGDEFAVLLKSIGNPAAAQERVKILLETLQRTFHYDGKSTEIKASVGFSLFPEHGTTYSELIKKSDLALYTSKRRGKSIATLYSEEDSPQM